MRDWLSAAWLFGRRIWIQFPRQRGNLVIANKVALIVNQKQPRSTPRAQCMNQSAEHTVLYLVSSTGLPQRWICYSKISVAHLALITRQGCYSGVWSSTRLQCLQLTNWFTFSQLPFLLRLLSVLCYLFYHSLEPTKIHSELSEHEGYLALLLKLANINYHKLVHQTCHHNLLLRHISS